MAIDPEQEMSDFLSSIPQPKTNQQLKAELASEQATMSRDEIARRAAAGTLPIGRDSDGTPMFAPKAEAIFDPETAVAPEHNWVDRGLVMSCEGAGHANHRHYKVNKRR